jgi:ATPase family associated with various cellular activities (AAA)
MSDSDTKPWEVIVTGDISLDKHIYKGERANPEDKEYGTDISNQKGGAYIIYEILISITEMIKSQKEIMCNQSKEIKTGTTTESKAELVDIRKKKILEKIENLGDNYTNRNKITVLKLELLIIQIESKIEKSVKDINNLENEIDKLNLELLKYKSNVDDSDDCNSKCDKKEEILDKRKDIEDKKVDLDELIDKQKRQEKDKIKLENNLYVIKRFIEWTKYKIEFGLKENIFEWENMHSSLVTYATWQRMIMNIPEEFKSEFSKKEIKTWKVSLPLGFGSGSEEIDKKHIEGIYKTFSKGCKVKAASEPEIDTDIDSKFYIFDCGGQNFSEVSPAWENYVKDLDGIEKQSEEKSEDDKKKKKIKSKVVLKTGYPLTQGKLFKELTSVFKEGLIILTSIDEIRKDNVLVSKGISWEQTALDLVRELANEKNSLNKLLKCEYLVVNFRCEGALYINMKNDKIWECRLVFDPVNLEGEWLKINNQNRTVIGLNDVVSAGIAYGLLIGDEIESAIKRGLSAAKRFVFLGHGTEKNKAGFPFKEICKELMEPTVTFASAFVPIPDTENIFCNCDNRSQWTILEGNYWDTRKGVKREALFDTGRRYALLGEGELANTPVLKIRDFVTYDRWEIEALRNIKNLIDDYLKNGSGKKPLSIGVFGGPGSGKSFAVKNIAKSINEKCFMEFNLSQFVDVHELEGAFHQVRDKKLNGITPVVFWDEFDSQEYRWLQYLLAPMQDGAFQEGQLTHPIGKCIFIFAGATSYTYETFGVRNPDEKVKFNQKNKAGIISNPTFCFSSYYKHFKRSNNNEKDLINYEINVNRRRDFILKKGPDFVSRLDGYLNVKGPNQLVKLDQKGNSIKDVNGNIVHDETDIFYPIRRALYIRNTFKNKCDDKGILQMDSGVINALIKTREYKHGARSLMHILSYTKSSNTERIQRSSLPTRSVMEMVVDYDDFIKNMNEDCEYLFKTYSIASEIHGNWSKFSNIESSYKKEFNHLPSHTKTDNIEAAKRIKDIVEKTRIENIGFEITADPNEKIESFNKKLMEEFYFIGDSDQFKDFLYNKLMFIVFKFKFSSTKSIAFNEITKYIKKRRDKEPDNKMKNNDLIKDKYAEELVTNNMSKKEILEDINKVLQKRIDKKILQEVKSNFGNIYDLAKIEHDGWQTVKNNNGWEKVESQKSRNDDRKFHHDMIPFEELPIGEILKDVDAVCNIEDNLKKVGLYIKEKK